MSANASVCIPPMCDPEMLTGPALSMIVSSLLLGDLSTESLKLAQQLRLLSLT